MRLGSLFFLLLGLAGISSAQDTSFAAGPQYLVTGNSSMFLHSIATPTLSLNAPLANVPASTTETTAEPSSLSARAPVQPDLTRVYWGTPDASVNVAQNVSEIEITSAEPLRAQRASIVDVGVTGMTSAQSLRERGYGVTLGETAAFWKAHKRPAARLYTNADVQRLHQT